MERKKIAVFISALYEDMVSETVTGLLKPFFQTPEEGAQTAIYLASSEDVRDITGEYFYRCRIAKSSKRSWDMELARRFFAFSEALVTGYL